MNNNGNWQPNTPFIIAEAGINHNGEIKLAKRMIDLAYEAGASAIKFQTFKAEEFCGDPTQQFTYRSQDKIVTESMLEMFKRCEFSETEWFEIAKYAAQREILFFSTPQNVTDLELLLKIGVQVVKVGSDDLTNTPLISEYSRAGLPLILSCGMSTIDEVENGLIAAGLEEGKSVSLLVCTSEYPAPPESANILRVKTLKEKYPNLTIGFSDHTQGNITAVMAVALGATIFEKHFTLDHQLPGPDHWFSCDPTELKSWVYAIKEAFLSLGDGIVKPTTKEIEMRTLARRSVVALANISPGDTITLENTGLRRPGGGIPPAEFQDLLGSIAISTLKKGTLISKRDSKERLT
jgi:sialic acid synthase SpsE